MTPRPHRPTASGHQRSGPPSTTEARYAVIHYHEIALKGRNRPRFVRRLIDNIERAVADLPAQRAVSLPGRLMLEIREPSAWPRICDRLERVFGIANFCVAHRVSRDLEALTRAVIEALAGRDFPSFRIVTRRADKTYPLTSMEIDKHLGEQVRLATAAAVDLTHPALTIHVELLPKEFFFYFEKIPGAKGVPVGTGGTMAALLSGGIDSPVAAFRMMKRGCRILFIHFHSVPFLSRASQQKVKEIVEVLTQYQYRSHLFLVAFGDIQRRIMLTAPAPLRVILYRRFMLRIANAIARRRRAKALVTGESLGQVASQTIENLSTIERAAGLPVLRPLVGMDKDEIIGQAQAIGTYDISILPDQDCCQLFIPSHPATRCRPAEAEEAEKTLPVQELVSEAVREAERFQFRFPREE